MINPNHSKKAHKIIDKIIIKSSYVG